MVSGSNFISSSVINWNGSARTTSFVSASPLTASIRGSDIATAGTPQVTVVNPAPGGGTSGALTFSVNNPVPMLGALAPASTPAGVGFTLIVNGSNFIQNVTVVKWNGQERPTTFVSNGQLTAAISADDTAAAGLGQVTVFNPTPGGGESSAQILPVFLNLATSNLVYDSFGKRIFASVPADASSHPNTITLIDPALGMIQRSLAQANDPGPLAISDDGTYLYVGLNQSVNQAGAVQRFKVSSDPPAPDLQFSLGSDPQPLGPRYAESIRVIQGAATAVAVARRYGARLRQLREMRVSPFISELSRARRPRPPVVHRMFSNGAQIRASYSV